MTLDPHSLDTLQDFVDGRLDGASRARVDEHLRACATCRADVDRMVAAKAALRRLPRPELPPGLANRVIAALNEADDTGGEPTMPRATARGWLAATGLVAAMVIAVVVWQRTSADLPELAGGAAREYRAGRLALTWTESDARTLNTRLDEQLPFSARVFDLGMMGYQIVGGRLHRVGTHESALWVYRGERGVLVCQMYRGTVRELPPTAERREANGFTFFVYHSHGETQVFWQEGDVICVLASNLPSETVIELAIAKAMKPAP